MKYTPLPAQNYIDCRIRFTEKMLQGSLAVFNSNDLLPTNADGHMAFKQNSDLFYLTGVDQEETMLVIFPDSFFEKHREILFVKETNSEIAIWEGAKLNKQQATEATGIKTVYWLSEFNKVFATLMSEAQHVYLNTNEHTRASIEVETRDARFGKQLRENYPLHQYKRAAPIMQKIRSIKTLHEIEQIQKACNITEKGFKRLLKFVKPTVNEYEIEAELAHEFLRNGSRGFAYTPIIASGFNACVLHYIENDQACKAGDVILIDAAAEYGGYASDLTRCIPVSGKFTPRQKAVYNAVLRVMKGCIKILKPGILMHEYHLKVGLLMEEELIGLGLLDKEKVKNQNADSPLYKKYFMHGTSHFLGLDVHDVGIWTEPIQAGMVFTIEPGIYIREENLGIRLEDNILITENGNVNLMKNIPLEADDIEKLMQQNG